MSEKVTILIPSCDAYADAWEPFFYCFNRSWPDCPFEKILISNHLEAPDTKTKTIKIGDDKGYCDNLIYALEQIDSDYIILWLEDLLLAAIPKGDTTVIIKEAIQANAGYLRLWQISKTQASSSDLFYELPKDSKFRVSLKPALWKKSVLLSLLVPGESPHDLERKGSIRSNELPEKFLSLTKNSEEYRFSTVNLIYRGKYEQSALNYLKKIGFDIKPSNRKIKPQFLYLLQHRLLNPIARLFKLLGN
ncbi:hypothetical protein [Marinoscillum pacificum]|uniref:hypothetical protein n=1 Tax=Marinoscillum pacificum TaxID=392723 RepID=UPI00215803FB|nr:hypothetical protein [Marinoscillum pacificum]